MNRRYAAWKKYTMIIILLSAFLLMLMWIWYKQHYFTLDGVNLYDLDYESNIEVVQKDDSVFVILVVTNNSEFDWRLSKRSIFYGGILEEGGFNVYLNDTLILPYIGTYGPEVIGPMEYGYILKKGEKYAVEIELNSVYDLTMPGKYRVVLSKLIWPKGRNKGFIKLSGDTSFIIEETNIPRLPEEKPGWPDEAKEELARRREELIRENERKSGVQVKQNRHNGQ